MNVGPSLTFHRKLHRQIPKKTKLDDHLLSSAAQVDKNNNFGVVLNEMSHEYISMFSQNAEVSLNSTYDISHLDLVSLDRVNLKVDFNLRCIVANIFAFGCIVFEIYTGQRLFSPSSLASLISAFTPSDGIDRFSVEMEVLQLADLPRTMRRILTGLGKAIIFTLPALFF